MAATLVDSLDTLWLMDLKDDFAQARDFVAKMEFNKDYEASTFECTIRYVGGLLSAYELSGDEMFLRKAVQLADHIMPAFNSGSGLPYNTVNLASGKAHSEGSISYLAEVGSLQLEWRYLSYKTGDPKYAEKVNKVNDLLAAVDTSRWSSVYPTQFNVESGQLLSDYLKLGSRGDSFYEILYKQYLQSGKKDQKMFNLYKRTIDGIEKELFQRSKPDNLLYIAEKGSGLGVVHRMDHLVCFMGGLLALDGIPEHLQHGADLTETCYQLYHRNPSGLAPEIAAFVVGKSADHGEPTSTQQRKADAMEKAVSAWGTGNKDFFNIAPHNLLRPETVESIFYMYRITGDKKYQDWGWEIFQAFEKHSKTSAGYSGCHDVGQVPVAWDDRMESFFLAETMKYLYLLFAPTSLIPLDEFVFNTEAHPTRIFRS